MSSQFLVRGSYQARTVRSVSTSTSKVVRGGPFVRLRVEDYGIVYQQGDADQPASRQAAKSRGLGLGLNGHGKTLRHIAEILSLSMKGASTFRARIVGKNSQIVRRPDS